VTHGIPPVAVNPFLIISTKDISFVKVEVGVEVRVKVEAFPAISSI
jgi:hypothetical protein